MGYTLDNAYTEETQYTNIIKAKENEKSKEVTPDNRFDRLRGISASEKTAAPEKKTANADLYMQKIMQNMRTAGKL